MCPIFRKLKKDGNTFYRAAFFDYIENFLGNMQSSVIKKK